MAREELSGIDEFGSEVRAFEEAYANPFDTSIGDGRVDNNAGLNSARHFVAAVVVGDFKMNIQVFADVGGVVGREQYGSAAGTEVHEMGGSLHLSTVDQQRDCDVGGCPGIISSFEIPKVHCRVPVLMTWQSPTKAADDVTADIGRGELRVYRIIEKPLGQRRRLRLAVNW